MFKYLICVSLLLFFNASLAQNKNNPTTLNIFANVAKNKIKEIEAELSVIECSSVYIPLGNTKMSDIISLYLSNFSQNEQIKLYEQLPEKYDIFYMLADETRKKFDLVFLQDNKLLFICLTSNDDDCKFINYSFSLLIPESTKSLFANSFQKYKLSNLNNRTIQLDNLPIIINLFGPMGSDTGYCPVIIYGFKSKIFGVLLPDIMMFDKKTLGFKIESTFECIINYFNNVYSKNIEKNDSMLINEINRRLNHG